LPTASEIASRIGATLQGQDMTSLVPASLAQVREGSIVFLSHYNEEVIDRLNSLQNIACVTTSELAKELKGTVLVHEQPRLAFCLLLNLFYQPEPVLKTNTVKAIVSKTASIGERVEIGPGSLIGDNVIIGSGTSIGCNVVIAYGCEIGRDCVIKSNTTIGEVGFGFVRDENQRPIHFPHIGSVSLGDRVEIGANCTVVRAALDTTRVSDDVKTDDHVHIAHNVFIGERCLLAAGAVLSGSVHMGEDAWVGPNAVISDHLHIGNRAWIAIGSVVLGDVPDDGRMLGNPAKQISNSGNSDNKQDK